LTLQDLPLLADESIHPDVVDHLRKADVDVVSVREVGLSGHSDRDVIGLGFSQNRVVLTHDRDFGRLAIAAGEPLVGIVYVRPGHIDPQVTVSSMVSVLQADLDLSRPFVLVVDRRGRELRIRLRHI
jgi:predicted nuclease of predicted toxin-antitoxin system